MSVLLLYGKEEIHVKSSTASGKLLAYQVEPFEVNYVSRDQELCIAEDDLATNLWECITEHLHSKIGCILPWNLKKANVTNGHLCSSEEDYLSYHKKTIGWMNTKSEFIENNLKCTPMCNRMAYSAKLVYTQKLRKVDEFQLKIYYAHDKYPIKTQFYMYSTSNLIADFGGYLGLLLGYSLLGFYDTLADFFEYTRKMCKEKYHKSSNI